jgi:transcriptional regulator with XRE-family HTH domain
MKNLPAEKALLNEANLSFQASCFRTPGERLKFLRKHAHLTLTAAAERAQIARSEINKLENGARRLRINHAVSLATAYGLSLETFYSIFEFDPNTKIAKFNLGHSEPLACRREIRLVTLAGKRLSSLDQDFIQLSYDLPLSPDAFALKAGAMKQTSFLPEGSIAIADPAARTVLGDLVFNENDVDDPIMRLHRNQDGELVGLVTGKECTFFGVNKSVRSFVKIVCILPAPYLFTAPV